MVMSLPYALCNNYSLTWKPSSNYNILEFRVSIQYKQVIRSHLGQQSCRNYLDWSRVRELPLQTKYNLVPLIIGKNVGIRSGDGAFFTQRPLFFWSAQSVLRPNWKSSIHGLPLVTSQSWCCLIIESEHSVYAQKIGPKRAGSED